MAELRSRTEVPGGPYINVWSGIGVALENNQEVANLVGCIVQHMKATAGSMNQASQIANQSRAEVADIRAEVVMVVVSKKKMDEGFKVRQVGGHLLQITQFLAHVRQEMQQQNHLTRGVTVPSLTPPAVPFQVNDIPVEDALIQLQF
jgi:hypothetical protein